MTLAELIDMTRVLTRDTSLIDGTLAQFLNVAQDDVSRALRAPSQVVFYKDVAGLGGFNWPSDAREDGIVSVYALTLDDLGEVTASRKIPVYDFDTASAEEPNWTSEPASGEPRFIVHDPQMEVATPVPVPNPAADNLQSFRIHYVVKPGKMVEMGDEPFNGKLDSFHDVLAYRAAWLMTGNQAMLAEYERRMREARSKTTQGVATIKNSLYAASMATGTGR